MYIGVFLYVLYLYVIYLYVTPLGYMCLRVCLHLDVCIYFLF